MSMKAVEMKKDISVLQQEKREVEEARTLLTEKVELASVLQTYNVVGTGVTGRSCRSF